MSEAELNVLLVLIGILIFTVLFCISMVYQCRTEIKKLKYYNAKLKEYSYNSSLFDVYKMKFLKDLTEDFFQIYIKDSDENEELSASYLASVESLYVMAQANMVVIKNLCDRNHQS